MTVEFDSGSTIKDHLSALNSNKRGEMGNFLLFIIKLEYIANIQIIIIFEEEFLSCMNCIKMYLVYKWIKN